MPLLTGLTADGTEVPVQVEPDGVLVAEGIQGAPGPEGPKGDTGPQGPKGDPGSSDVSAWACFECNPAQVKASSNVSSITRTDVGVYDIVFTTPMPDENYAVVLGNNGFGLVLLQAVLKTANGFTFRSWNAVTSVEADAIELAFSVYAANGNPGG